MPNQVPTSNYLPGEAEGAPGPADAAAFHNDVSARFEATRLPRPPWSRTKMDAGSFEPMARGICAYEFTPGRFEGIRKLSQNSTSDAREGVVAGLPATPNSLAIAREMRKLQS